MDESAIALWRKWTYDNLSSNRKFTKSELKSFVTPRKKELTYLELQDILWQQLEESLVFGDISHEDLVFVICDSSVMCDFKVQNMLSRARNQMNLPNAEFILLDTHIGHAENTYKMEHAASYNCVNFKVLQSNLKYLRPCGEDTPEIHSKKASDHTVVMKTDFLMDNHVLTALEDEWLKTKKWVKGCRNEINDDAQLDILCKFVKRVPHSRGIIISNDRGLVKKAHAMKSATCDIMPMQIKK
jgi:hypothetical protein